MERPANLPGFHSNKLTIQRKGLLQQTQILRSRYFDCPEILQMTGDILRIQQTEVLSRSDDSQSDKSNLRGIRHFVKHRFTEKRAINTDPIKTAC